MSAEGAVITVTALIVLLFLIGPRRTIELIARTALRAATWRLTK
jgi:hypothetical protein